MPPHAASTQSAGKARAAPDDLRLLDILSTPFLSPRLGLPRRARLMISPETVAFRSAVSCLEEETFGRAPFGNPTGYVRGSKDPREFIVRRRDRGGPGRPPIDR